MEKQQKLSSLESVGLAAQHSLHPILHSVQGGTGQQYTWLTAGSDKAALPSSSYEHALDELFSRADLARVGYQVWNRLAR